MDGQLTGFLLLGFLMGMSHALEADHLAAVSALATREREEAARAGRRPFGALRMAMLGASWGMGHALTLLLLSLVVVLTGRMLSEHVAAALEFAVGVMLVVLGLDVLRRMWTNHVHFHAHDHGDGRVHLHAHSHAGSRLPHDEDPHHHEHPVGFSWRAFVVGLMHGAAGTAGLMALAAAATRDMLTMLVYVILFGLGALAGMALLTCVVSWPLGLGAKKAAWTLKAAQAAAAVLALGLGAMIMRETAPAAFAG
jgi:high-affinity nickel permease